MRQAGPLILTMLALTTAPAVADPLVTSTYTLYGTPGLIEMPTAESAADAELSTTFTAFGDDIRNTLSFQITPRLSGSFRYAKLPGFNANTSTTRYDRSFDLRFRVFDERKYLPAVAVGLQDFIGTGVYSSEYVVATKSIGSKIRVSGGLGWGRLGTYNSIGAPLGERPDADIGLGGTTNAIQWFRGKVAPFGGASFAATEQLTFKVEYSSDAYIYEVGKALIDRASPWNFGVDYGFKSGVRVAAAYTYGDRISLQVTLPVNPRRSAGGPGNEPGPLPVQPREGTLSVADLGWAEDRGQVDTLRRTIGEVLARDGIVLEAMALTGNTAQLRLRNQRYPQQAQALGRVARILTRALPASVEIFVLTPVVAGVPSANVTFRRSDLEALENAPSEAILLRTQFSNAAGPAPEAMVYSDGLYPRFSWSLGPYVNTSFFDPDAPVRIDTGIRLAARYDLMPGVIASGSVIQRVAGNLGDINRTSNSVIQKVRTDAGLYLSAQGPVLEQATLAYYARPWGDFYSRITAGYLERMYGGLSTELLWKPVDSKLALGAELNYVKQRAFDGRVGFRDYEVLTGHASAYYSFENGYHGQVDVGRYLAGDYGATLSIDREFTNGWRVGAFATLTDVPFADFGEGSFDKGIRLRIPLSWALGRPVRNAYATTLRPLTRDGGARLGVAGRLYERVRSDHQPEIAKSWGRFWR
jgi:hypothetical protein